VLKYTLNRYTTRVARGPHGRFALVRHVGRKSGKTYETPIIARPIAGGFMIELTYGPEVDWYRNITAANGCHLIYHGVDHVIIGIEPVSVEEGIAAFSPFQRVVLTLLKRKHFVRLTEAESVSST
jgi:deazaflavin-dependent oxidoreductase (nitroreductase family)